VGIHGLVHAHLNPEQDLSVNYSSISIVHMHENLHHNILWYTDFTAKISSKEMITEPPRAIYLEDTTNTRYYSMLRLPTETL
jgi:hypothetical protein